MGLSWMKKLKASSTQLRDIGKYMNDFKLEIPAFPVKQPIGDFFVASIDAQDLVDISFSDVRRMEGERKIERYLGIQRPLNSKRVKDIRRYITQSPDATFPSAVILAIDEKCVEYDQENNKLILYPYHGQDGEESIPTHKIAKVLDGQHRIAGFFDGVGDNRTFDFDKNFNINVSIFVGIDLPEQAKFATVNLAQTKVNKSLVYDLESVARKRNPFKTCHNMSVALNANEGSPFEGRIKRLGVATPGRKHEPLTQAAFVESLVRFISKDPEQDRNLALDGKKLERLDSLKYPFRDLYLSGEDGDIKIYQILWNYFSAIRAKWPKAWEQIERKGNLLPKSNAFKAFMRYLRVDVYPSEKERHNLVPSSDDFMSYFDEVALSDEDFTTKNFVPGSGGESMFYKVLTGVEHAKNLIEN